MINGKIQAGEALGIIESQFPFEYKKLLEEFKDNYIIPLENSKENS